MNGRFFAFGCIGLSLAAAVYGCAEPEALRLNGTGGKSASGTGGKKSSQGGSQTGTTGEGGQKIGQGGGSQTGATGTGGQNAGQGGGSQTGTNGTGSTVGTGGVSSAGTTDPIATGGLTGTGSDGGAGGTTDTTPPLGIAGGEACNNTSPTPCGLKAQYCQNNVCACPTNQTVCGTTCVGLAYDNANCGQCGVVCATPRWCDNGKCNG